MIQIQLRQATLAALKARLADARTSLKNDGSAMRQVAVYLDQWVQRNFQGQGTRAGGWAGFKAGGRKRKGRKGVDASARLLQDTGALRLSFMPFIRMGAAGIGSDLPRSKAHEFGLPERNLPQRRMLPKPEDVQVDVEQILENFVRVSVKRVG